MTAVTWQASLAGCLAGLLIAVITAPVGVSGAVFLLPVQLSVLDVPSPAVTPTNLLFNVVAVPGALLRHRRGGHLAGPLTRQLVAGTLPGVVAGAVIRVYLVPGPRVFRLIVAVLLLPLGLWLTTRTLRPQSRDPQPRPSRRTVTIMALARAACRAAAGWPTSMSLTRARSQQRRQGDRGSAPCPEPRPARRVPRPCRRNLP